MAKKASIAPALLIAIVPGVAIYWLTQGFPDWLSKKPAADPPVASQSIDGRVIDANAQRLLLGADVLLELGGVTSSNTTDSLGRYLFVAKAPTPIAAVLTVHAQGYQDYSLNLMLNSPELMQDIMLQPQPVAAAPATVPPMADRLPRIPSPERKMPGQSPAPPAPATVPTRSTVQMTNLAASIKYSKRASPTTVTVPPRK